MTQREEPRLALIETALVDTQSPESGALRLRVPRRQRAERAARLDAGARSKSRAGKIAARRSTPAKKQRNSSARYLGSPVRLVRFDTRRKRAEQSAMDAGRRSAESVLRRLSVAADLGGLARGSQQPPGAQAADESLPPEHRAQWPAAVRRGSACTSSRQAAVRLRRAKPCTRCIVTTTDQSTGTRDGDEPLRTLAKFRFDRELKGVVFGQNLILIEGIGAELRVGQDDGSDRRRRRVELIDWADRSVLDDSRTAGAEPRSPSRSALRSSRRPLRPGRPRRAARRDGSPCFPSPRARSVRSGSKSLSNSWSTSSISDAGCGTAGR